MTWVNVAVGDVLVMHHINHGQQLFHDTDYVGEGNLLDVAHSFI